MKRVVCMEFFLGLLIVILQSCVTGLAVSSSNFTDQSALLAFISSIKHDPNNISSNWTRSSNFCNWVGVTCSQRRQRVTALRLPSMSFSGTISPHIGNLSFLRVLDLHNNSFYGAIAHELGQLIRLETLELYGNQLEGEIPASIQHCKKLRTLSLQGNFLTGGIPPELTNLTSLNGLFLGMNNLSGTIPASLGNMSVLEWFGIEKNRIYGNFPYGIVHLRNLKGINFLDNYLIGPVPPEMFNMSTLKQVLLTSNAFTGTLPSNLGLKLPNLEKLALDFNQFSGEIPLYLSNATKLDTLALTGNKFIGPVRTNFGQLKLLERFSLGDNLLSLEPGSSELSILTSMTNCSFLQFFLIDHNPWGGFLPNSIGNLSSNMQRFDVSSCQLKGAIPRSVGSLKANIIILSDNNLGGTIPSTIGKMENLQRLYLDGNEFEGSIPDEICLLRNLGEIYLQNNALSGLIPTCIGNLSHLQILFLNSNKLNSSIPMSFWSLQDLSTLNMSSNLLVGTLDVVKPLKALEIIDLSWNQISGEIPSSLGDFQSLLALNLSRNSFWGSIPRSFGDLITLDFLDLSHNNLSGAIPKTLESLLQLNYLNLSFNKLSGEIPSQGPFKNLTAQSFMGNEALCGLPEFQVPPCRIHRTHKQWRNKFLKFILPSIVLTIIIVASLVLWKKFPKNKVPSSNQTNLLPGMEHKMFSYWELCHATNNFAESNLIGMGSFGSVYKGTLSDGSIVAVKILNLQVEGAFKSFDTECKVFRSVRHRNLVKVVSACSNDELRALVLQYMPNGSLDNWLYSPNYSLNLVQRLGIAMDVALALEYLHHSQVEPIIHCDLKPSNVLLDEEMVAHVADFGIAKVLAKNRATTQTQTLGTIGYIAPEYGYEGRVSTKGDIYSYGIMLLEMLTLTKPTDTIFDGDLSLKKWVSDSLPDKVVEIVDVGLLKTENREEVIVTQNCILALIELGLQCSADLANERPDVKEVVPKLNKIKLRLQHGYHAC